MIYTLTLNPSVDYYMDFNLVRLGALNRSSGERCVVGGKGINVSRMLNALGLKSTVIAAVGGFTGQEIKECIISEGLDFIPLPVSGTTRINVKLNDGTELNGSGAMADVNTVKALFTALDNVVKGDTVVLSGSVCSGFDKNIYARIIAMLNTKGVYTVLDADGALLKNALESRPNLIKPNSSELGALFNADIEDVAAAEKYALKLVDSGIENVIVSMGDKGALYVSGEGTYFCKAPQVSAVTTVGAGDCALAGFIYALESGMSVKQCTAFAVACGSARVNTGIFADRAVINEIFDKL